MIPDLRILRWKCINIILKRYLVSSSSVYKTEVDLLQSGSWIFDIYLIAYGKYKQDFTTWDVELFDQILLVSFWILKESTFFDFTILNPINFLIIIIMEHGLTNNPANEDFKIVLFKLYYKLGCTSKIKTISDSLKSEYYKRIFSKYLFSFFSKYGLDKELEKHINQYSGINETIWK